MKRIGTLFVSALLMASLLLGCTAQAALEAPQPTGAAQPENSQQTLPDGHTDEMQTDEQTRMDEQGRLAEQTLTEGLTEHYAASYAAVLAALKAGEANEQLATARSGLLLADGASEAAVPQYAANSEPAADMASSTDYSGTNVQVEGVDEADVVKTDGQYIYSLRGSTIYIYQADGAQSRLLTELTAGDGEWFSSLYLSGSQLLVIGSRWDESEQTNVTAYDISDPARPRQLYTSWQDGWYQDSRLTDGRLYLISTYGVWDWREAEPQSYIPAVCDAGEARILLPGEIWLPPECSGTQYVVTSCFDVSDGALLDTCAVLGGGGTTYCTGQSLYLAWQEDSPEETTVRTVENSTVTRYSYRAATHLLRFDLQDGLRLAAETTLDGYLDSQFSLDEYQGFLRLVLTREESWHETWEEDGKTSYRWPDENDRSNSLVILDSTLKQTGSIEGLGQGERIYSARFDGDYGYFVTFRQTDPLFCVELSDPYHPVVRSELQLPGFSDYLQLWSQGRLLGLGYDGDETGTTGGLKLSMYDTTNPVSVSERHTLPLDYYYSQALYNHKALLLAADRNLIGFPTDEGYAVFGYDDAGGFTQRATVALDWEWDARGLYIGDCLYICGDSGLTVLSLDTLEVVQQIETEREWAVFE